MRKVMLMGLVIALAIGGTSVLASAEKGLDGTYTMIASGSCLHSLQGFIRVPADEQQPLQYWKPITDQPNSYFWTATTMASGTWNFYHHGTGTLVNVSNNVIDFYPGHPANGVDARTNFIPVQYFHYDLSHDGDITVKFVNPQGVLLPVPVLTGSVSVDHKSVTLGSAMTPQVFIAAPSMVICNNARTLIRVGEDR